MRRCDWPEGLKIREVKVKKVKKRCEQLAVSEGREIEDKRRKVLVNGKLYTKNRKTDKGNRKSLFQMVP